MRSTVPGLLILLAAATLFAVGCSGSNADEPTPAAIEATVQAEPTAAPSPTAAPTPTPVPEPSPTSGPTPDPLLVEAEAIALEYSELTAELFNDPRNMDLSRMIALEAGPDPRQPMTDYALRAVADLLEDNRYRPNDGVRYEVVGSQWAPDHVGQLAWIDICTQTGAFWFDLDTDEPVMEVGTDPFTKRVQVLTDTMQIAAISESGDSGSATPCEFTTGEG